MRFDLTAEQKQLCDSIERGLTNLVDLAVVARDASVIEGLEDRVDALLTELGLPLVMVPEAHGGLGMGLLTVAAAAHVLGRHAAPGHATDNCLAAWAVAEFGSEAQREKWLSGLLSGEVAATFALREDGLWEPDHWRADVGRAQIEKRNVRLLRRGGLAVVGTRDGLAIAAVGPEAFRPDKTPLDLSRPLATLSLAGDALEPLADRAGAWRLYDALLIVSAIDAAGAGQQLLAMAVDYAKTRKQFDSLIGSFQGLKHQLAEMAVDIGPAHFPCWFAAHAWDLGDPGAHRSTLLAKAHATDMAVKTGRRSVECHGGIAYTWEYPLHFLLKRAMQDRAALSSPSDLRRRVAQLDDEANAA
jgi:alkylation response protein AidB-like acyl-CoA dehydrogenase